MTLTDGIVGPQWTGIVAAIDAGGNPTGEMMWGLGGDGDYVGNETHRLLLSQIAGNTIPCRVNNGTDSVSANLWKNKIHILSGPPGGTTYRGHILINKDDHTQWQPCAGHHYNVRSYHPTHGLIDFHHRAPPAGTLTPVNNPWPYADQTDPLLWGLNSHGIPETDLSLSAAVIGWNPLTSLWSRLASLPSDFLRLACSDWNHTLGKFVFMQVPSSENQTFIYEWDGVPAAAELTRKTFIFSFGGNNQALMKAQPGGRIYWLHDDIYLIDPSGPRTGIPFAFELYDNAGAGSVTVLTGANGNPILQAAHDVSRDVDVAIDRANGTVYWMVADPVATGLSVGSSNVRYPFMLYKSTFSDLMNLVAVPFAGQEQKNLYLLSRYKRLHVYNGFLYAIGQGANLPVGWSGWNGVVYRLPLS